MTGLIARTGGVPQAGSKQAISALPAPGLAVLCESDKAATPADEVFGRPKPLTQ